MATQIPGMNPNPASMQPAAPASAPAASKVLAQGTAQGVKPPMVSGLPWMQTAPNAFQQNPAAAAPAVAAPAAAAPAAAPSIQSMLMGAVGQALKAPENIMGAPVNVPSVSNVSAPRLPYAAPPSELLAPTAQTPGNASTASTIDAANQYVQQQMGRVNQLSQGLTPGKMVIGPNMGQLLEGVGNLQRAETAGSFTPAQQSHAAGEESQLQNQNTNWINRLQQQQSSDYNRNESAMQRMALLTANQRLVSGSQLASNLPQTLASLYPFLRASASGK